MYIFQVTTIEGPFPLTVESRNATSSLTRKRDDFKGFQNVKIKP